MVDRSRVELRLSPTLIGMVDNVCRTLGVGRNAFFAMAAAHLAIQMGTLAASNPGMKRKDLLRVAEETLIASLEDVRRAL